MVMGTDAGVYPHGDNLKQLSRMVTFGMSEAQALQSGTYNGAKLLGQEAKLGELIPNAFADIIAVKGNPLVNIEVLETISFVMKDGAVIKSLDDD